MASCWRNHYLLNGEMVAFCGKLAIRVGKDAHPQRQAAAGERRCEILKKSSGWMFESISAALWFLGVITTRGQWQQLHDGWPVYTAYCERPRVVHLALGEAGGAEIYALAVE